MSGLESARLKALVKQTKRMKTMTNKILIGMGVLVATAVAAPLTASAAGAGASARAHMNIHAKSHVKTVAYAPNRIRRKLRARGYYNIRITDRRWRGYRARACKNGRRFVLKLNRFGRIINRDRRGWCGFSRHKDRFSKYNGGPRRGAGLHVRGPGFSVTVRKRRH